MDPQDIRHGIRHQLSRMETNNFQDKSGCSINGFRSFLFEEGIVHNLDDMEILVNSFTRQDYRGYPIDLSIEGQRNFQLSDEILRMKNVQFNFHNQTKPNHKLVFPEPHFVEEERNLIENHFKYLGDTYNSEDIGDWECFEMDNEGHLVSMIKYRSNFQLSNESIEHLSTFPSLRNLQFTSYASKSNKIDSQVTNLSLLSNLRKLSMGFENEFEHPELFKDLGLFTNLLSLSLLQPIAGNLTQLNHYFVILF